MEYGEVAPHILQKAAENGKLFHQTIQEFFRTGQRPRLTNFSATKLERKIQETIDFLEKEKFGSFCGSEKLYYIFHKKELLATYIDLEFQDYIIELKTSNLKASQSPTVHTGQGVIFRQFQVSEKLLKILDILLDLARKENTYSPETKKEIIQGIVNDYSLAKS
ncbi:21039_t:CDS:2, partial [Racocetra persica]